MKHDTQPIYHAQTMPSIRTESFKRDQAMTCPNIKITHPQSNTTIPIIKKPLSQNKDQIVREGLVLCTQTKQWYARRYSSTQELQLRKTRLRWRRFKAVLWPDRLELYHISKVFTTVQRLAHVIYLDSKRSHNKVKLSMISTRDFIWSLEFAHRDNKSIVSFHFQSSLLSEAEAWYMAIYPILPPIPYCKRPIPSYLDIHVILDHGQPLSIRLPLDSLRYCYDQQHIEFNVRLKDVKSILCSLLERYDKNVNWRKKELKLCWRHASVAALVQCDQLEQSIASGSRIEWIHEQDSLVGPQLIEKSHLLELHVSTKSTMHCPKKSITFDGLLIQKINQNRKKHKRVYYYAILYGHHLFFFDSVCHNRFKRQDQQLEKDQKAQEQNGNKLNWFSATTGFLFQQRKLMISKQTFPMKQKRTHFQLGSVESSPHFKLHKTEWMPPPDPARLMQAKLVLDLHQVISAQPLQQQENDNDGRTFEIRLKSKHILYYEAPNTQIMLEWVTLINSALKLDRFLLHSTASLSHHHGSCHKNILLSGLLYLKHNFAKTFKSYYCVLCKNEANQGILLFEIMKKNKTSLLNCHPRTDKKAREEQVLYEKKQTLIDLENAFVFSGEECILDHFVTESGQEPLRYYKDGVVTGGDATSDCVFVIWQAAKRHFVPDFREYLSLLKLGHRLGNRGSCWVFKARSKQERDEWVWALHVEFGLLRPSRAQ